MVLGKIRKEKTNHVNLFGFLAGVTAVASGAELAVIIGVVAASLFGTIFIKVRKRR